MATATAAIDPSARPVTPPSLWDWVVFWVLNKIHLGAPILNWLFGFAPKWTARDMKDKTGQVVVVTGANSGTGYATAQAYYDAGAKVYLLCRSEARATEAIREIQAGGHRDVTGALSVPTSPPKTSGSLHFVQLDLADLDSVEAAASVILGEQRLDVLFANAGIMAVEPGSYTKQGYSLQFGTNVVGHQCLISRLLPLLRATSLTNPASPSRLICTTSIGHELAPRGSIEDGGIDYGAIRKGQTPADRWTEYGASKWGNIALARYVNAHYGPQGPRRAEGEVLAFSAHPGPVATNLAAHIDLGPLNAIRQSKLVLSPLQITPDEGALNQLWAANLPLEEARRLSGAYITVFEHVISPRPDLVYPQAWEKLWNWCEAEAAIMH